MTPPQPVCVSSIWSMGVNDSLANIDNRLIVCVYLSSLGASFFRFISFGIPFLASCVTISALAAIDWVGPSAANAVPRCGTV